MLSEVEESESGHLRFVLGEKILWTIIAGVYTLYRFPVFLSEVISFLSNLNEVVTFNNFSPQFSSTASITRFTATIDSAFETCMTYS